jgi:heme oxygenase
MNDVRSILRLKTARAHKKLDEALGVFDLKTPKGLSQYLKVHLVAYRNLRGLSAEAAFIQDIDYKISLLCTDLDLLGEPPAPLDVVAKGRKHHLTGLTYVIAGSSLGGKLLARDWALSRDPVVKKAGNFINNASITDCWREFLAHIELSRYKPAEVEQIVHAAIYCFGVYQAAYEAVSKES